PRCVLKSRAGTADEDRVTEQPQSPDGDESPHGRAGQQELDFVEYFDDGEWHAQLIDGRELVASGEGGNPSEARAALLRSLGLS
ncbi:MAG: hypothetical protein WBF18_09635, partial [Solirubrobacterales bacterium]